MLISGHSQIERLCRLLFMGTLICFAVPNATANRADYQRGVFVEENLEWPCAHECGPFETVYYDFCIRSGEKTFLARLFDTRFNYDPNKLRAMVGKNIRFRTDDKNLWIVRPDGKEFRVKQDYSRGYFLDSRCVAELHRHILQEHPPQKIPPEGIAGDAVYVPQTPSTGYWTKCFFAPDRAIVCFARGPKGEEFSHVYQAPPEIHDNSGLSVDPLRTNYDTIVLATGQKLSRKYD